MYKARWPRSGQDRVTSGQWSNQAEAIWPICTSARLPSLCVSVLFSLFSPCISVSHSVSVCPSLCLSLCVCVFLQGLHDLSFLPTPTMLRIRAPAAPYSEQPQHLLSHLHPACPSSFCVPLPRPPLLGLPDHVPQSSSVWGSGPSSLLTSWTPSTCPSQEPLRPDLDPAPVCPSVQPGPGPQEHQ